MLLIILGDKVKERECVMKTIKLEKIEVAEQAYLLDEHNEMISEQQMKQYNILPNPKRIQYLHNLLRKYNLYNVRKPNKSNRNKLKLMKFNKKEYAIRKLLFNFGKKLKRTRPIKAENSEQALKLNSTEEESISEEITVKGEVAAEEQYDYEEFKKEYYDEKEARKANDTLKAKAEVAEKKVKEAVEEIVNVKAPKKCSREDKLNYGLKALQCLYRDIKSEGWSKDVKTRVKSMFTFWLIIYLSIVIPLWLVKGWCCCCIPLKICRPYEIIYHTKTYIVHNPPGVLEQANGEIINYQPIPEEINTFRSIELNVFRFR
ncbi:hypothetical protein O3M35_005821 [Rhynocoris fuscipes]|uniref:Uncharacterized protein n=1 Tax=Rhynocoris fuscipes TaxID=488301 RepID=A0AAW1DKV6_9HEMI